VVEEVELGLHHIEYRHDREPGRPRTSSSFFNRRRARRTITSPESVRADDEELVSIDSFPWTNELLPPPRGGVDSGRRGM